MTSTEEPLSHGYQIDAEVHRQMSLLKALSEFATQTHLKPSH